MPAHLCFVGDTTERDTRERPPRRPGDGTSKRCLADPRWSLHQDGFAQLKGEKDSGGNFAAADIAERLEALFDLLDRCELRKIVTVQRCSPQCQRLLYASRR